MCSEEVGSQEKDMTSRRLSCLSLHCHGRWPLSIWRLCWRTSFSLLTLWNVKLALLRQDPSRAFMESVLACGFCRRFQQHSRKERGEQPFFLWHRRDGGCTQSAASGAGEPAHTDLGAKPVQPLSQNHVPGGPTWRPWSHREGSRWHLAPTDLEFWELHLGERRLSHLFCLPWCCGHIGTQPSKHTGSSSTRSSAHHPWPSTPGEGRPFLVPSHVVTGEPEQVFLFKTNC